MTSNSHRGGASILVVSRTPAFVDGLARALPEAGGHRITTETAPSFATMNGRASALIAKHDVVIFDAPAGDRSEMEALAGLLAKRRDDTLFLALADEGLSIAEARKLRDAGVGEVLPDTVTGAELGQVVEGHLRARKAAAATGGGAGAGVVIAVSQARGGIGATTLAVNLAHRLVREPRIFRKARARRVVLVDLDLQFGSAGALLDLEDNGGLLDLIRSGHAPDAAELIGMLQVHASGLSVLCAPAPLVPLNAIAPETVGAVLDTLRGQFDYVVVDLPRALVEWIAPVLTRAGRLALVTDTSVPCIRQAKRVIEFYRDDNASLQVDLIVNREARPLVKPAQVREAESVLGMPFAHWLPDAPREARKAADLGRPVVELYPSSRLGRALGKIAASMSAALPATSAKSA